MDQIELFAAPNPCVGVCENSPKGYCRGCMRSRDERFYWHQYSVAQKLSVLTLCARRYQRMMAKHNKDPEQNLPLDLVTNEPMQMPLIADQASDT